MLIRKDWKYRILFVAGGRRTSLAELFFRKDCSVLSYELDQLVPLANLNCKVFSGKKWKDPELPAEILKIVEDEKIDLIVPLDCNGVLRLSKLKDYDLKAISHKIVCSPFSAAEKCTDKLKLQKFMEKYFPSYFPSPIENKPFVKKPRFGFGSNGVEYGELFNPTDQTKEANKTVVFQNKLPGPEYSVDCYFNKNGKMVGASPRERLWVAGGEVLESTTVDEPVLIKMTKEIGEKIKIQGPGSFQYRLDEEKHFRLIEINGRLGGGATISIHAGLDIIQYIIDEYILGKTPEENSGKAQPNIYCSRSFRDHFFKLS